MIPRIGLEGFKYKGHLKFFMGSGCSRLHVVTTPWLCRGEVSETINVCQHQKTYRIEYPHSHLNPHSHLDTLFHIQLLPFAPEYPLLHPITPIRILLPSFTFVMFHIQPLIRIWSLSYLASHSHSVYFTFGLLFASGVIFTMNFNQMRRVAINHI